MATSNDDNLLVQFGIPSNNISMPFEHNMVITTTDMFEGCADSDDLSSNVAPASSTAS